MARRSLIIDTPRKISKRHKISASVRCEFNAIPARWTLSENGDLVYSPAPLGTIDLDPWTQRQKFISLQRNQEALLTFLNEVGSWDVMPSVRVRDYWEWQDILRAVLSSPGKWMQSALAIDSAKAHRVSYIPNHRLLFQPDGDLRNVIFTCSNHSALDAIIMSVCLDEARLLRQRPFVGPIKVEDNKAVRTSRARRRASGETK